MSNSNLIKCKHLKYRRKQGIIYMYCSKKRIQGDLRENICDGCIEREFKSYKSLKKITKKQKTLENNRYSILTNNLKTCYVCKKRKKDDMHEIYPGSSKQASMKNGFCIPICRKCHSEITNNEKRLLSYKVECQKEFEKTHTREDFIKIIGRSYIDI